MKLGDEDSARYHGAFYAYHSAVRRAEMLKRLFEAEEYRIHLDTPPGKRFDVWGDRELKPADECEKAPGG